MIYIYNFLKIIIGNPKKWFKINNMGLLSRSSNIEAAASLPLLVSGVWTHGTGTRNPNCRNCQSEEHLETTAS